MARTYAQICDLVEALAQDGGINPSGVANSVFATAELDLYIPMGMTRVADFSPYEVKVTKTTTASRNLTLTVADKYNLLRLFSYLEYKVDKDPQQFRNFTKFGDVLTMKVSSCPVASESVYLYMAKKHVLQKEVGTTDLSGALNAGYAAGVSSLALKLLGTGTINQDTVLMITGDTTVYAVTAQATIATNAAAVTIAPVLAAAALESAVVTLSAPDSTLDVTLEECLAQYTAGLAAKSKARLTINKVNIGRGAVPDYMGWGQEQIRMAEERLRAIAPSCMYVEYTEG